MTIKFSTEKPTLVRNPLIIDGITRSGKFFLGKIISGFNKVEYFQHSFFLDYLSYMTKLGAISQNGAITLLRSVVDQSCYDQSIGRNLNSRVADRSSLYNSPYHEKYFMRSKTDIDREKIVNYLSNKNQIFPFVCHNNLANCDIMFKAFPDLRIIHMLRNPIDIAYSWMNKDYGKTELNSNEDLFKIGLGPSICGKNGPLPWYVNSIKSYYESLNQADRIIATIKTLTNLNIKGYRDLSDVNKNKVLFVKYENLVEATNKIVDTISKFIGNRKSELMDEIIMKEKCPNVIDPKERIKKKNYLMNHATKNYSKILKTLENKYFDNNYFDI